MQKRKNTKSRLGKTDQLLHFAKKKKKRRVFFVSDRHFFPFLLPHKEKILQNLKISFKTASQCAQTNPRSFERGLEKCHEVNAGAPSLLLACFCRVGSALVRR